MLSGVGNEKMLDFSLNQGIWVDNSLYIPVPNEYRMADYSFLADYADSVVIVPEKFAEGDDPSNAELALIIQSQPIPCGMMYDPEKIGMYSEVFCAYYPVFSDKNAVNVLNIDNGCGILYQLSSGSDAVDWKKYHGIIFAKTNGYIFHLIGNRQTKSLNQGVAWESFFAMAVQWLERIMLPESCTNAIEESSVQEEEQIQSSENQGDEPKAESSGVFENKFEEESRKKSIDEEHPAGTTSEISTEAKIVQVSGMSHGKKEYLAWLSKRVSTEQWFEMQLLYETIERYSNRYHLISRPLLEITDLAKIQEIKNVILTKKEFCTMGQDKRYLCGLAMRYYEKYLSELCDKDESVKSLRSSEFEKNKQLTQMLMQQRKEAEERRQKEEQLRQQKEEERRRREEELVRRKREAEEHKSRYNSLVQELREQKRIVEENRGWFGMQAKRRKAAKLRIQQIQEQLLKEYPNELPSKL